MDGLQSHLIRGRVEIENTKRSDTVPRPFVDETRPPAALSAFLLLVIRKYY
jgi:hypothetical protein